MPSTHGIKIDGLLLTDDEVRIISLLIYGLSYRQIESCTGIAGKTVRNTVSGLYGRLMVKGVNELNRKAHAYGFDFHGCVHGVDVLTKTDRIMLFVYKPVLKTEKPLPRLVYAS